MRRPAGQLEQRTPLAVTPLQWKPYVYPAKEARCAPPAGHSLLTRDEARRMASKSRIFTRQRSLPRVFRCISMDRTKLAKVSIDRRCPSGTWMGAIPAESRQRSSRIRLSRGGAGCGNNGLQRPSLSLVGLRYFRAPVFHPTWRASCRQIGTESSSPRAFRARRAAQHGCSAIYILRCCYRTLRQCGELPDPGQWWDRTTPKNPQSGADGRRGNQLRTALS